MNLAREWLEADLERAMEKFSHDLGDQRLIEWLEEWLSINMGEAYEIRPQDR